MARAFGVAITGSSAGPGRASAHESGKRGARLGLSSLVTPRPSTWQEFEERGWR